MEKYKNYSIKEVYTESGKVKSLTLPDDCKKVVGVHIIPQLPNMAAPNGKAFLLGNVSVLINNKIDNALHDYPLMVYPDKDGKMSLGENYAYYNNHIKLNTQTVKGNVITFVFKDSSYMDEFVQNDAVTYGAYNVDLDIYIVYQDERGDWSNNKYGQEIRLMYK